MIQSTCHPENFDCHPESCFTCHPERSEGSRSFVPSGLRMTALFATFVLTLQTSLLAEEGFDERKQIDATSEVGKEENESYLLRVGDRIRIKIYPEDDYIKGGEMEVSSEGNVTLPLVGKVKVADKSVIEAERAISQILAEDYIVNPEVVMEVLEYKKLSVVVLGEVKKPGTYQFPPGQTKLTLLQAVSMAGGFSDIANIKKIRIVREEEGKKQVLQANGESIIKGNDPDIPLKAGDVINVSESLF